MKLAVLSVLLCACSGTSNFIALDKIEHPDPNRYPADGAVVLQRDYKIGVELEQRHLRTIADHWRETVYLRIAILKEAGLGVAKVTVPLGPQAQLTYLRGRTIGPHGEINILDRAQIARVGSAESQEAVAQLPNVQVGSTIECEYEVEHHNVLWRGDLSVEFPYPVVQENIAFRVYGPALFEVSVYNSPAKPG